MTGCSKDEKFVTSTPYQYNSDGTLFISGMGCSNPNCTDASHHHNCPSDCNDYSYHHTEMSLSTEINYHNNKSHHSSYH